MANQKKTFLFGKQFEFHSQFEFLALRFKQIVSMGHFFQSFEVMIGHAIEASKGSMDYNVFLIWS